MGVAEREEEGLAEEEGTGGIGVGGIGRVGGGGEGGEELCGVDCWGGGDNE